MRIGIFGFGAVGNAIYNELEGYSKLFVLVNEERLKTYKTANFYINHRDIHPTFISNGIMDVIFITVKNYNLREALPDLKPFIGRNTILIPLLNGIMAHDIIKDYYPMVRVCYGAINIESNKKGNETICGKILNLQYGDEFNIPVKKDLLHVKMLLDSYHINNYIYHNMKKRVWLKWMLNLGINQISALMNASYKDMSKGYIKEMLYQIFKEVYQVSLAYHIGLTLEDVEEQMGYCNRFSSERVTSLTLDFNRGGENELESFGGVFTKLAEEKNINVPVNATLYRLLRLKKEKN